MILKKEIVDIKNSKLAVYEAGNQDGETVIFIHGFGSYSYTWEKIVPYLSDDFHLISVDLKGFGFSECANDDLSHMSPLDNAKLIRKLIISRNYSNITVVGHSLGGLVALLLTLDEEVKDRIKRLNLVASSGYFYHLPEFIDELRSTVAKKMFIKYFSNEVIVRIVMNQLIYDNNLISSTDIEKYALPLRRKNSRRAMAEAARQINLGNVAIKRHDLESINIPILITCGENDKIMPVKDAENISHFLPNAHIVLIEKCGHAPQFEKSKEVAMLLKYFINGKLSEATKSYKEGLYSEKEHPLLTYSLEKIIDEKVKNSAINKIKITANSGDSIDFGSKTTIINKGEIDHKMPKVRLRNLVDKWSISVFILLVFLKILQILRKIGFRAEETGWRKATSVYLRSENSKFSLAIFRLKIPQNVKYDEELSDYDRQCQNIIHNLAYLIRRTPEFQWKLKFGYFKVNRFRHYFVDIVKASFEESGKLKKVQTFLENEKHAFTGLSEELKSIGLKAFVEFYNKSLSSPDKRRPIKLKKELHRWLRKHRPKLAYLQRSEMHDYLDRVVSATFISFDVLSNDIEKFDHERLATPHFSKLKHPGSGLLNIKCRLTHNFKEADLWFQFHHMPVDGQPMQEVLDNIKQQWGNYGQIIFPETDYKVDKNSKFLEDGRAKNYEVFQTEYQGKQLLHGRFFINFSKILKLRKKINKRYYNEMGGNSTLVGLLIWAMANYPEYRNKKFLIPVDLHELEEGHTERDLSVVVIRPGKFIDDDKPLSGLVEFQREFNLRMRSTQLGLSASYELIEIFALSSPILSTLVQRILPKAFSEFVGTMGLSVLRNAEVFIAPLIEFHSDGFIAIGNVGIPNKKGEKCGSVSVHGSRERVENFYNIIGKVMRYYDRLEHSDDLKVSMTDTIMIPVKKDSENK